MFKYEKKENDTKEFNKYLVIGNDIMIMLVQVISVLFQRNKMNE